MNTLDAKTLDELAELERKATVGPWHWFHDDDLGFRIHPSDFNKNAIAGFYDAFDDRTPQNVGADVELVTALRNHATTLISAARRLAAAEAIRELLVDMEHHGQSGAYVHYSYHKLQTALADFGREVGNG